MKNNNFYIPSRYRIISFRRRIMEWIDTNGRNYLWRNTGDPFRVLIAEMMLRRTRADQVNRVYQELFNKYPDVESCANANENELNSIIYHLGLRWRSPAFKKVARLIIQQYSGKVPETREEILNLPGVGDYVAGAVLSIAYNKKEWMVDSNIVRVYRRYFGMKTSREGRRDKHVIGVAKTYVSTEDPRKANLAILDFAALVCTPTNPKHDICPVRRRCLFMSRIVVVT